MNKVVKFSQRVISVFFLSFPPSFLNKKFMLVRLFMSQCSCESVAVPAPPTLLNWLANFYQI